MRKCAVFTIVRDEPYFLTRWLNYYERHFESCDIYVLQHVVADDEEVHGGFQVALSRCDKSNVIRVLNPECDVEWLRRTVTNYRNELLKKYQCVLFAESDELVFPTSVSDSGHHASLRDYIDEFIDSGAAAAECVGYEIHHDPDSEPSLDHSRPVLDQRKHMHANPIYYNKTLLVRDPSLRWSGGFHTAESNEEICRDGKLILFHLHKFDFDYYMERHTERAAFKYSDEDLCRNRNYHYRLLGKELIASYHAVPEPLVDIPRVFNDQLSGV